MLSRLSLRYRIALVIFLLETCMLAGVLGVVLTQSRQTATDFDAASQEASLALLSNLSITALLTSEYSDYQLYIQDVQKQPSLNRIALADVVGRVVAGSRVSDVGHTMDEVVSSTEAGWRVQPVNTAAGKLGILAVQFSDAALTAAYQRTRNLALAVAIAGMVIIAFVGLATGFALTRRLGLVTVAARRLAEGDYQVRSKVAGGDEVALLSRSFDRMADAVGEQQQQLKEQSEYIELLLDSTEEAIHGIDTSGICTFANPACLRMLGYEHEDQLIGKNVHALIHHSYPDGRPYPKEQCKIRLATRNGQAAHADDEVHWRADGSSFPVEYWSRPMYRDRLLVGTVVTFIDITERVRSEEAIRRLNEELELKVAARTEELAAANKELEAFAYSVSHDLRAPLRGIDGFSQVLVTQHGDKLDPDARRMLDRIRAGAQRMGHLITDLLQLSRVARSAVQNTEVDLSALAQSVVDELKAEAAGRELEWHIEPGMTVHGDRRLLHIALANLLGNALKYTRDASPARIEFGSSRLAGDVVEFCIRDNGAGFDMAYADRLFLPFQRLHGPHEFEGTGIGLATVLRVIAKHGGVIRGEGRPGAGAAFYFTLPA